MPLDARWPAAWVLLAIGVPFGSGCGLLFDSAAGTEVSQDSVSEPAELNRASEADVPVAPPPETCTNASLDATETDVDCGGSCAPCTSGARCLSGADCRSGYCLAETCAPEGLGPALTGLVAYYDFQAASLLGFPDALEANPGQLQPDVTLVAGPFGDADRALQFPVEYTANDHGYAWIAHSEAWNLDEGSIDFWFWVPETLAPALGRGIGVLSRDADRGAEPNHLILGLYGTGSAWTVGLRQQESFATLDDTPEYSHAVCTEPEVETQTWHHLGFNFGGDSPNSLTLNGVPLAAVTCWGGRANLQQGYTSLGIGGNQEPFVLGHDSRITLPGGHFYDFEGWFANRPERDPRFAGGRMAHVRISSVRRDFDSIYASMATALVR